MVIEVSDLIKKFLLGCLIHSSTHLSYLKQHDGVFNVVEHCL